MCQNAFLKKMTPKKTPRLTWMLIFDKNDPPLNQILRGVLFINFFEIFSGKPANLFLKIGPLGGPGFKIFITVTPFKIKFYRGVIFW